MKILNLHVHNLNFDMYDNKLFRMTEKKYNIKPNSIFEAYSDNYLFSFSCKYCDNFYNDYKSYKEKYNPYYYNESFFYNKNIKIKGGDLEYFEFVEFCNLYLLGTKNEIISYICKEYDKLNEQYKNSQKTIKNLDSNIKNKEKDILKIQENLQDEKKKMNRIENNFKAIKSEKDDLSDCLKKEKEKSSKLNSKITELEIKEEKLTEETNIALNQLEKEKQSKKDLELKFSELQEQEKQKNIKNRELEKNLSQKKLEIEKLTKNNKDLGINVKSLKKNLYIKDDEIKEINNSLNKEKNLKKNILQELQSEKDKNQQLNKKLDNISFGNNENIRKVLTQLENEKQSKKDLELKFSELQQQEIQKNIKNRELEKELKNKDEELKNFKNEKSFGLKFESDNKSGDYDIVLDITSFQDLVNKDKGWKIKYNKKDGKEIYLKKKDEPTIIVGVIGNGNKGKSFFLEKLSGYNIPKGFNIKTEGLSIRYGRSQEHNVAILDSAGQETPLLKVVNKAIALSPSSEEKKEIQNANSQTQENEDTKDVNDNHDPEKDEVNQKENKENKNPQKSEQLEGEDIEFEKYSRDKLITEFFLQKFIIWKSDILILVVGNISLTEQKLLSRVKAEVEAMNENKQIYVIHNLKDYSTKEQVEDYIENTLKNLYKIEIKEIQRQKIRKDNNEGNCFNKLFVEKGNKVIHLIFVNEFSEQANYYNPPTIEFIQKEIEVIKTRNKFSILDDCIDFLVRISEEIMEENLKRENLHVKGKEEGKGEGEGEGGKKGKEEQNFDKIILENMKEITLKKFVVDEMGYTLNNDSNTPKYSYYIDTEKKMFFINIELPGGGSIEPRVEIVSGYYIFIFEGEKKGDCVIEENQKRETSKLLNTKNLRKSNKFKLEIKISNSIMQIKIEEGEDLNEIYEFEDSKKGVYTFKYKVLILNQKNEKTKKKKKLDL